MNRSLNAINEALTEESPWKVAKHKSSRRVVDSVLYSTALQRRRTEELRRLRVEEEHLSDSLTLKQAHHTFVELVASLGMGQAHPTQSAAWRQLTTEYKKRRHAEEVNAQLKAIQAHQTTVSTAIRRVLQRIDVSQVNRSIENNKVKSTVKLRDGRLVLDAVCIFHRYDEGEQTVLVGTTLWSFPTGGLQFEGHHWTTISPTLSDPSYTSVVQSCYKLQTKSFDAASILPADLEIARELVMATVGKKMHATMQLLQNALLSHVDLGPCLLKAN